MGQGIYLRSFARMSRAALGSIAPFESFNNHPSVRRLQWPEDVIEQWLYDHASNENFLSDYGKVDLSKLCWKLESVPLAVLLNILTGPSDEGSIESYETDPGHWVSLRTSGIHEGVPQMWQEKGTWKRPPLLIERALVVPGSHELQLIEGRTRVGVLRGFHRQGRFVAGEHLAWVARTDRS